MDRRNFLVMGLAGAASALFATPSQAAAWVYLGRRKVNGLVDQDMIHVGTGEGRFSRIRLHVTGNDLLMHDLDIRYRNGQVEDLKVRDWIRQGGYTRAIDLQGGKRRIAWVKFKYGKFRNGRGATWVHLFGRR